MIKKYQFCYGPDTGNQGGSGAGDGGSTAESNNNAGSGAGAGNESTWIPESLRTEKTLEKFKSQDDALKAYVELERKLGKSVEIPSQDASAEVREKFYERIGRPKTSEEYVSEKPLKDSDIDKAIRSAHGNGLTKEAYGAIASSVQAVLDSREAASKEANDKEIAEAEKVIKEKYGDRYDRVVEFANEAFNKMPVGLQKRLTDKGFANDPEMIELLAVVLGPSMKGDKLIKARSTVGEAKTPESRYSKMEEWYSKKR